MIYPSDFFPFCCKMVRSNFWYVKARPWPAKVALCLCPWAPWLGWLHLPENWRMTQELKAPTDFSQLAAPAGRNPMDPVDLKTKAFSAKIWPPKNLKSSQWSRFLPNKNIQTPPAPKHAVPAENFWSFTNFLENKHDQDNGKCWPPCLLQVLRWIVPLWTILGQLVSWHSKAGDFAGGIHLKVVHFRCFHASIRLRRVHPVLAPLTKPRTVWLGSAAYESNWKK